MRHDGQIGETRLLRHDILLAARHRGETGSRVIRSWMRFLHDNVMTRHETLEHRTDGMRPVVALLFGGRHHLFDHRAGQALPGQRRDVAAVHADVQRE